MLGFGVSPHGLFIPFTGKARNDVTRKTKFFSRHLPLPVENRPPRYNSCPGRDQNCNAPEPPGEGGLRPGWERNGSGKRGAQSDQLFVNRFGRGLDEGVGHGFAEDLAVAFAQAVDRGTRRLDGET